MKKKSPTFVEYGQSDFILEQTHSLGTAVSMSELTSSLLIQ
ncbi:hypothetical protein PAECIP111893_03637 [Paenibacillus plantiphilus]|uniref:Uncharacterized protein n=1 Tax=Paenibacillus plantiphilus TaxID=2905650 RepID=A0ABM9CIZ5_9BACL|nr:hypothetical protein [Paenibacillus plantiphilus]CAH1213144.1 hypothetical protein PAECIP111893_03637 [Paenibacillus plantiphilus]